MNDLVLDNSAISLLNCDRKFQLVVGQGLYRSKNKILQFGDAYHKAQEYIDKGSTVEDAIARVFSEYPDVHKERLLAAVTYFRLSQKIPSPLIIDDQPFIEQKFKFLYRHSRFPGDYDVYLAGTIDRAHIEVKDDILAIVDYKTGLDATDSQIQRKIAEYELSFQLPFYTYCLLKGGLLPAKYNDYLLARRYRVEIWFCFYNTLPTPTYKRLIKPAFNEDFLLREVPTIIDHAIERAIRILSLPDGAIAPHVGMTVYKACDRCDFRPACMSMGTAQEASILERFERRQYDPLSFR